MKKTVLTLVVSFVAVVALVACDGKTLSGKPGSSGKTQELMIVAKEGDYNMSKAAVDSIFSTPQEVLNQPEPRFETVRIAPSDFDGNTMFQAHRNILMLEVAAGNESKVYLEYDKWSSPQVVVRITARDNRTLDSILLANEERLLKEFYNMEYRRMKKVFSQTPNVKVNNKIKEKYGFSIVFPEEFMLAKMDGGFTWVRKETKDFGIGVLINSVPYSDNRVFEEWAVLDNLDTIMKRNVPGPDEGSYMGTERRDFFRTRDVELDRVRAVETRGLWRLYNGFMSGPFVCYTFRTPDGANVVTMTAYVYSPSQRNKMSMKRDLLMQVDGICRSIEFPNQDNNEQ